MTSRNPLLNTARGPLRLAILLVVPTLLIASWLWAPTRASWDALDLLVFRSLNDTLTIAPWWQTLWAFCNTRVFDVMAGLVLMSLLFTSYWEQRVGRLAMISLALAVGTVCLAKQVGGELIIEGWLDYARPSPTLAMEDCHHLTQLVPTIECKDESPWCFPSDHGTVVLSIAIYMSLWSQSRATRSIWLLSLLLLLPRLVSGGHWLTDVGIGSLSIAMFSMALLMGTGLHDWAVRRIGRLFELEEVADLVDQLPTKIHLGSTKSSSSKGAA